MLPFMPCLKNLEFWITWIYSSSFSSSKKNKFEAALSQDFFAGSLIKFAPPVHPDQITAKIAVNRCKVVTEELSL